MGCNQYFLLSHKLQRGAENLFLFFDNLKCVYNEVSFSPLLHPLIPPLPLHKQISSPQQAPSYSQVVCFFLVFFFNEEVVTKVLKIISCIQLVFSSKKTHLVT